ncbi:hypothetical protein N7486_005945 [Penicillium sp. IBT 16267x]|nr:hypothetical protein N7486_005945 [Penicillium sp. IBT 16267x]
MRSTDCSDVNETASLLRCDFDDDEKVVSYWPDAGAKIGEMRRASVNDPQIFQQQPLSCPECRAVSTSQQEMGQVLRNKKSQHMIINANEDENEDKWMMRLPSQ